MGTLRMGGGEERLRMDKQKRNRPKAGLPPASVSGASHRIARDSMRSKAQSRASFVIASERSERGNQTSLNALGFFAC